jgi:cytochrome c-type biogenesis protein CcsB
MKQPDVTLFWVSFWMYLVSFLLFSTFAAFKRRRIGTAATVFFIAAFVCHTGGLAARWILTGHPPFSTMYEYAVTLSWAVALTFIFITARFARPALGVAVSPLLVAVLVIASLLPNEASKQLMPALQSYWFYIHVTLAALAEGAFIVAAGAGMLYLLIRKETVEKGVFPNSALLEEIISRSIRIGYPLFTIGAMFAGAIWAHYAWGSFWSWDPKETGSLVIWLYYTLLLHQNVRGRWRGRKLATAAITGFILALVSFVGNLFFGGLHSYI